MDEEIKCYSCNSYFINHGYNFCVLYIKDEVISCEICDKCIHDKYFIHSFMPDDYDNSDFTNYFILNNFI